MQFKVPQFLDIEDKIFGPFTFRQFVYIAGGGGVCFVLYKLLGFVLGAIPILIVAGFAGVLAFYRPNNKPFINMLESSFKYATGSKLYVWQRRKKKPLAKNASPEAAAGAHGEYGDVKLGTSKLKDLAWSLDVLDLKKGNGNNDNENIK